MNRRKFIINNNPVPGGLSLTSLDLFISNRPLLSERTLISNAVENTIREVKSIIADKEIAWMFENCFPNTLDTTVDFKIIDGKPDTFIVTGDIDAMWLRDSTAQVWPYLPLVKKDDKLRKLVLGLVNRQVKCVLIDPYANAFYKDPTKKSKRNDDKPIPVPGVHERKWEIDSLCYVIRLSHRYYEITGDKTVFDSDWDRAIRLIVDTWRTEQRKNGTSPYYFQRGVYSIIDTPVKPTGMICSMFRPSDDATLYPYLLPSNIFAVLSLHQLSDIYNNVINDSLFAKKCTDFANEVDSAVNEYGISEHLDFGEIYAYEVDGFGNKVFMDDANVPSLMSLAYLGAHKTDDPVYKNTRRFLLSDSNPYYLCGSAAEGQASPHTGKEKIWPMGIILRAMTSQDKNEINNCLKMLKNTHGGTGFMHEAFHKDNPDEFTREWFAWANTLFGELIIKVLHEQNEL